MTQLLEQTYQADFQRLLQHSPAEWLNDLRSRAMQSFTETGFPTTRHEEWRFTNLTPIARTAFQLPEPHAPALDHADIRPHDLPDVAGRLVFLDGRYQPDLSYLDLPASVAVHSLAHAIRDDNPLVRQHLARYAQTLDPFAALNTAFIHDGALIHIQRGATLPRPIHLLMLSSAPEEPTVTHPRTLIVAEPDSRATIIEQYVALADRPYLSNAVTEVLVGPGADIHHYFLERESNLAFNVSTLHVDQDRASRFESHTVLLGGSIVRNNIHVELRGEHCDSLVNGLFLPRNTQHMDNHMRVVHAAPNCDSRQFYKGILDDRASGVFSGRIVVRPDAQKTDAKQTSRNLLLTDDARIDAKPQLEIYADDVKCTHGATIGQLDANALFYMQARGIPAPAARALLIYAFAHESLERMTFEPLRARLEKLLLSLLPHPHVTEALL